MDSNMDKFFQAKSLLRLYRAADWVPERIPDEDVTVPLILSIFRLAEAKRVIDPVTGRVTLEDTDLVKRARSIGMDDATIMEFPSKLFSIYEERPIDPHVLESIKEKMPAGFKFGELPKTPLQSGPRKCDLSTIQYLETLKLDLVSDISGQMRPVLSVNYVVVLARFMLLFMQIEEKLKSRGNPSWVQA